MILYGLIVYSRVAVPSKSSSITFLKNKTAMLPKSLQKFETKNGWDLSTPLIRGAEALLGLPPMFFKYKFGLENIKAYKSKGKSYFREYHQHAKGMGDIYDIPPFNTGHNVLMVDMARLAASIYLDDHGNQEHKAYLLLVLGLTISMGQRMFLNILSNPGTDVFVDEAKTIKKLINKYTLLKVANLGTKQPAYFKKKMPNCIVYDTTNVWADAYFKLRNDYPVLRTASRTAEELQSGMISAIKILKGRTAK